MNCVSSLPATGLACSLLRDSVIMTISGGSLPTPTEFSGEISHAPEVMFNTRAARAMREAFEEEKSGALICETADAKRLVFFEAGHLVGAKSDLPSERLGEIMVREGRIVRIQLEEATSFIRSGLRLGQILVELGYLKGGEIETYVRLQIIAIASSMLTSSADRLLFLEDMPVEAVTLSPVSIGEVFLDASRHLTDLDLYRDNVLIDDYVLRQTGDALALAPAMNLSSDEGYVLDLVDGNNTVAEVLARSPLDLADSVRVLVALHQSGIVALKEKRSSPSLDPEPLAPMAPEPEIATGRVDPLESEVIAVFNDMQCQNHWQILGLDRNAAPSEIEDAYREARIRFDPEKFLHLDASEFREKLSFIRARLEEAFTTLASKRSANVYDSLVEREPQYQESRESWETIPTSEVAPEQWERPRNPDEARLLFVQAKQSFREQDYWKTIELCRASIELGDDNDPERFHLLGQALAENPRWRKDAERNLKIAQKLKPWEPRYLVTLGKLYEKEGLAKRAQRMYVQARAMDPDFRFDSEDVTSDGAEQSG
jgi:tetratricopeptide (TPR) repeat protein